MKYTLKYIFRNEVREIFKYFTSLFGIRIAFFSVDGEELQVGLDKPICIYCQMLRNQLKCDRVCLDWDQNKRNQAEQKRELISYQCHGGMLEAIMPIYYSDNLVGFIMIGQFRSPEQKIPTKYLKQWQKKFGTQDLAEAYKETPCLRQEHIDDILGLFSSLVKYITSHRMIAPKELDNIFNLVSYIEEHPEENLSVSHAADLACCSTSTLTHQFKKATGKSFKQFQIDVKFKRAKELFQANPSLTIREVAYKLGFEDPLYFSKLYKKHYGQSPKSHLKKE